ncbi:hypothetical protein TIFTF001_014198 [Ficus carica]|uniref:Uncharacterized protein n=1 Tax=Ficus carica TaxID=3494 RepID=A0AA88A3B4_FICCA|nr:hypothetical protein TIFTF001_014198 [Ficus carica]
MWSLFVLQEETLSFFGRRTLSFQENAFSVEGSSTTRQVSQSTPRAKAAALECVGCSPKDYIVKAETGRCIVGIGGYSARLRIPGSRLWALQRPNVKATASVEDA